MQMFTGLANKVCLGTEIRKRHVRDQDKSMRWKATKKINKFFIAVQAVW